MNTHLAMFNNQHTVLTLMLTILIGGKRIAGLVQNMI